MQSLHCAWEAHMPCLIVYIHAHIKIQYIYLLKIIRWIVLIIHDPWLNRIKQRRPWGQAGGSLRC